ncbi:hypothetical protein [Chryseobacterium sp. 18068]|uniref:hypothetical protein n=1 Tax=Chryseobacterium sp. 18068 TaxID=2681414 RepID=UPI00135BA1D9|nr:hypothetical protein [Chryseobacterium sp. 18068]
METTQELKNYLMLFLNQYNIIEKYDNKGLPFEIHFSEQVNIPGVKLNSKNSILVNIITSNSKKEIYYRTKAAGTTFYNIGNIPVNKVIDIRIHSDYKLLKTAENTGNDATIIDQSIMKQIALNQRKTLIFQFSNFIYYPQYNLKPTKTLEIEIEILELSIKNANEFKPTVVYYAKKKSKQFYLSGYFPFEKCNDWILKDDFLFNKAKDFLESEVVSRTELSIKIKTSKTKNYKELVINPQNFVDINKSENLLPIAYILKYDRTIDRSHQNCLVCGTKLFAEEQIYVHILTNGYLTTEISTKVKNHFGFFPIGSECLINISNKYQFTKSELMLANRRP